MTNAFIEAGVNDVTSFVKENPLVSGLGLGLLGATAIVTTVATVKSNKSKSKSSKRRTKRRRKVKSVHRRKSRRSKKRTRRTPRTAGKRKDTSHKRIRYTKRGQPYIIMSNGRARFIKHKSAKTSHKKRGGKY